MGRNRKSEDIKKFSMTFAITKRESDLIDSVANALSISRSSVVSLALDYFDKALSHAAYINETTSIYEKEV